MNETRIFSLDAEQWQFRCSYHEIQYLDNDHNNYHIQCNNQNKNLATPFMYYDLHKFIEATIIFSVTIRSIASVDNRGIRLAIGDRQHGERVKMTEYLPVGLDWQTYEVQIQEIMGGNGIRVGVYWYDHSPINIVLDGMNTTISQSY